MGPAQPRRRPSLPGPSLFFNPIRYTSMGLAVIEVMMSELPIVTLGTTEMTTV
jgi:hypothetical protein